MAAALALEGHRLVALTWRGATLAGGLAARRRSKDGTIWRADDVHAVDRKGNATGLVGFDLKNPPRRHPHEEVIAQRCQRDSRIVAISNPNVSRIPQKLAPALPSRMLL